MADAKLNDDDNVEEIPQPIRGNKISKKNKKKNKNQQQDVEEDSAGIPNIILRNIDGFTHKNCHKLEGCRLCQWFDAFAVEPVAHLIFLPSPFQ